jgi:hypothetical protein
MRACRIDLMISQGKKVLRGGRRSCTVPALLGFDHVYSEAERAACGDVLAVPAAALPSVPGGATVQRRRFNVEVVLGIWTTSYDALVP